jgi:hypothetical protein
MSFRLLADERAGWEYGAVTVNWDLRHRKSSLVIRLLLAVWITVVVVVLCATGRWWGLVFVVPLVLDLYLLRRRDGGVARSGATSVSARRCLCESVRVGMDIHD